MRVDIENIMCKVQKLETFLKEIAKREQDLNSVVEAGNQRTEIEQAKQFIMISEVITPLHQEAINMLEDIRDEYGMSPGIRNVLLAIIEQMKEIQESREDFVTALTPVLKHRQETGLATLVDSISADWWWQKFDYYMHESVQIMTEAAERTVKIRHVIEDYMEFINHADSNIDDILPIK